MSTLNNGPRAFPVVGALDNVQDPGISLRDYFAAKAMAAIIQTWPHVDSGPSTENWLLSATAEDAYRFADAMLKERAK